MIARDVMLLSNFMEENSSRCGSACYYGQLGRSREGRVGRRRGMAFVSCPLRPLCPLYERAVDPARLEDAECRDQHLARSRRREKG
jgi:hypothetical protein